MRVVCFVNNRVGFKVLKWLLEEDSGVVGIVVHPTHKAKYGKEILALAEKFKLPILDGANLKQQDTFEQLKNLNTDFFVSVLFEYIFSAKLLAIPSKGCINLHNGYLPYNRGTYANVWSIVEGTPAGATLHYMDEGVDTGDYISRKKVKVRPDDTGKTLYKKIEVACIQLFKETWPSIATGTSQRLGYDEEGSFHMKKAVESIDHIDLDKSYKARDLINILRARTFPPYESAYFDSDGEQYFVRISISTNFSDKE